MTVENGNLRSLARDCSAQWLELNHFVSKKFHGGDTSIHGDLLTIADFDPILREGLIKIGSIGINPGNLTWKTDATEFTTAKDAVRLFEAAGVTIDREAKALLDKIAYSNPGAKLDDELVIDSTVVLGQPSAFSMLDYEKKKKVLGQCSPTAALHFMLNSAQEKRKTDLVAGVTIKAFMRRIDNTVFVMKFGENQTFLSTDTVDEDVTSDKIVWVCSQDPI